jgi:membrane protein DedA with SNARE-associated domain
MEALLLKFGYLLLFVGVAVEGEFVLMAGACLAHQGYFNFWLVILVALLANWSAVQLYYILAKSRGRPWLESRFGRNPHFHKVLELTDRYSNWLMFLSRFAIGFRIIIPAACGAVGMPALRFTILNLVGVIIWVVPVAWIGYYFGSGVQAFLGKAHRYEEWFASVLATIALAVVWSRHKRKASWTSDLSILDIHRLIPFATAFMGVVNLISALWPRSPDSMVALRSWLPLEVIQQSRAIMLFSGIALLQITGGLIRRRKAAWIAATIFIMVTLVLHIMRAFDLHHSLVAALLLAYLLAFRHRYSEPTEPGISKKILMTLPLLLLAAILYGYLGLSHLREQFVWVNDANPLKEALKFALWIPQTAILPQTEIASSFLGSLQAAGWMARLYILAVLLKPAKVFSLGARFRRRLRLFHKTRQ